MTLSGSAAQCDSHGDEARNTTDSINTRLKNVPEHILFRSKHMFSRWIGASIGSRSRSILGQIVPDKVRLVQNAHEVLIFQLDTLSIRGSNARAHHQQRRDCLKDDKVICPDPSRPVLSDGLLTARPIRLSGLRSTPDLLQR